MELNKTLKNLVYCYVFFFLLIEVLSTLRKDIGVKFPATSGESSMPAKYLETEDMIKKLKWERSRVTEDMQREQELLDFAKANFTRQV